MALEQIPAVINMKQNSVFPPETIVFIFFLRKKPKEKKVAQDNKTKKGNASTGVNNFLGRSWKLAHKQEEVIMADERRHSCQIKSFTLC